MEHRYQSSYEPDTHTYNNGRTSEYWMPEYQAPEYQAPPLQQQQFCAAPIQPNIFSLHEPDTASKLVSALSYTCGWFTGLLVVLFVRNNRYIRFHAMQSFLFYGGINVGLIVLYKLAQIHMFSINVFAILALFLLLAILAIGWFVGIIGALAGRTVKLPFVGDMAEHYANQKNQATVK